EFLSVVQRIEMPTVSNATPLIYLGKVGKLYFLKELYGEVFLASDIWEDLISFGKGASSIALAKELGLLFPANDKEAIMLGGLQKFYTKP
ncbi:MAG: hypothetical protein ACE5K4_12940, partial [Candidatus Hydrothermarchaeota archaeon]